jgi:hypothetical protein
VTEVFSRIATTTPARQSHFDRKLRTSPADERRLDGLNREFSHTAIHQTPDGALHVAYTNFRQPIKHVRIDPSWADLTAAAPNRTQA